MGKNGFLIVRSTLITLLITILFSTISVAQTNIYTLDFETAGGYTTSPAECTNGATDYFTRTDGTNIGAGNVFTNIQGSNFFAVQDMDGCAAGSVTTGTLTIDNIDISTCTGALEVRIYLAEDDDGSAQDWDAGDYFHLDGEIDAAGVQNLIWVEGTGSTNTEPQLDTDYDGTGDGTAITSTFAQFTQAISGTGSLLDLTLSFAFNSGDEDIAIDHIEIWGTCGACADPAPTNPDHSLVFTNVGSTSMDVSWTESGDATGSVVIINTVNSFTNPVDGTDPSANPVYGGAGEQVVYNGTGNSFNVSGLSATTEYYFRVYSYNCSGASILFNTSTGANNPNNETTTVAPSCPLTDDFSSGLGNWSNTGDWTINAGELNHNLSGVASNSYTSSDFASQDLTSSNFEWQFCMRNGSWDPSSSNDFAYYLIANESDLLSGTVDGYAVGINQPGGGSTVDEIMLYSVTNGTFTPFITIPIGTFDWGSGDDVCIRVTRTASGDWTLYFNPNSTTESGSSTVNNTDFTTGQYTGPVFDFSSTRAGELWIDDVSICGGSLCSDPAPTTQATNIDTTALSTSSLTIDWTNGDGSNRIVIMNSVSSFTDPIDGTDPSADDNWNNAGEQVVYNGTGNSVTITNLTPGTSYCFRVYESNCSGDSVKFLTTTGTNNPVCFTTPIVSLFAEGIIINEVSNGTTGNQEFYELIVAGTCGESIDIRGMIIDDNNGDFTDDWNSASGIARGHLRLRRHANWSNVPVGAIILIYNGDGGEKNPEITMADDPDDTNPFDSIYVLAHNEGTYLEITSDLPVDAGSLIPANLLYSPVTYTSSAAASWVPLSIRNGGDAVQTRDSTGAYIHGISYGTHGSPSTTLPLTGGPDDLYLGTDGSDRDFSFTRDDYRDANQWVEYDIDADATLQTPGFANNADNAAWISEIQDPAGGTCPFLVALDKNHIDLSLSRLSNNVELNWIPSWPSTTGEFNIQRSVNGKDFKSIAHVNTHNVNSYSYKDMVDMENYFYRIVFNTQNRPSVKSNIAEAPYLASYVRLFPNPAKDKINIWLNHDEFKGNLTLTIRNIVTQQAKVISQDLSEKNTIEVSTANLTSGLYILEIKTIHHVLHKKFEILH